jgi:NADH-quinone oxidoreductase subunit I
MAKTRGSGIAVVFRGVASLAKGLAITFSYIFRRPITVQYPEERVVLPVRSRGRLVLPLDPEKGTDRCTACMRCVQICPNHSIDVEKAVDAEGKPRPKAATYRYNLASCMFCNLCVEACPFFALVMSDEYELATTDRSSLVRDLVAERYELGGEKGDWWRRKFRAPAADEAERK